VNLNNVDYLLTCQISCSGVCFIIDCTMEPEQVERGGQVSFVVPLLNLTQV